VVDATNSNTFDLTIETGKLRKLKNLL